MNPDDSVGRLMSLDDTIKYYERVIAAEKMMGPLTREEKMVILGAFGKDVTQEELVELLKEKRVLYIKPEEA